MEEKNLIELPDYMVDYLTYVKKFLSLKGALNVYTESFVGDKGKVENYLNDSSNQEKFAIAWVNGFKKEEKLYRVKINNIVDIYSYLNMVEERGTFYFSSQRDVEGYKTSFTKEELENAGFSWLFDCEGVELIEVDK